MYLKVDNNGEEQIYSFQNQNIVVIGRAPTSDIQVVTDGISRKHLEVRERDGEFFIIDFGSTNGTFLNDERLEPNVEHSFNSFFPIKLGFHVYLYLVDEISPEQLEAAITDGIEASEEKRRSELKAQRTQKLKASGTNSKIKIGDGTQSGKRKVKSNKSTKSGSESSKRSRTKRKSRREQDSSDDEKLNMPLYIAVFLVIITGVAYSQGFLDKFLTDTDDSKPTETKIKKVIKKKPKINQEATNEKITKERVETIMRMDKCLGDDEKPLCKHLELFFQRDFNEGFVDIVEHTYLVFEYKKFKNKIVDSIKLTENDQKDLLSLARKVIGREFNQIEFMNNNYKVNMNIDDEKAYIAAFLFYLSNSDTLNLLASVKSKEFTFIGYEEENLKIKPKFAINIPLDTLYKLRKDNDLFQVNRIALYSGLSTLFDFQLRRNKDIDIKRVYENIYTY